jgi:hypothetical protein
MIEAVMLAVSLFFMVAQDVARAIAPPSPAPVAISAPAPPSAPGYGWESDGAREPAAQASAVVVASAAADEQTVTGTWNGTWEGQYGRGQIVLVLVQNAVELTGTAAIAGASLFSPEPQAIREGRISDRAVTFTVDGVAGRIDASATVKSTDAWGTFTFRGATYRFSVARQ